MWHDTPDHYRYSRFRFLTSSWPNIPTNLWLIISPMYQVHKTISQYITEYRLLITIYLVLAWLLKCLSIRKFKFCGLNMGKGFLSWWGDSGGKTYLVRKQWKTLKLALLLRWGDSVRGKGYCVITKNVLNTHTYPATLGIRTHPIEELFNVFCNSLWQCNIIQRYFWYLLKVPDINSLNPWDFMGSNNMVYYYSSFCWLCLGSF